MLARLFCAAAIFLLAAFPAHAQTVDVSILIDDRDGVGCTVTPAGLPAISGIDARLTATVDRLAAQVTSVEVSLCGGAAFGPPSVVGGGHPVGNDNGLGGADVVEMSVQRSLVTMSGSALEVVALADNGVGVDVTGRRVLGSPPTAVPGLGLPGLLVLGLAMLVLAAVALRRRRALVSVLLVGVSFAVLAANFMVDGAIGDWAGEPQAASDPLGDGTNGETAVDIVGVFAAQEDQGSGPELFFRVDMADAIINNQAPIAQDDAVATDEDTAVAGDLFADNGSGADSDPDSDPFTVTMVAGTATVGSAVNLPSGAQVTVNADGTFNYDPLTAFNSLSQGQSDTDTFTYTIDDGIAGTDQATVTVTIDGVNDVGTAMDDGYATAEDTPLAVGAPGVLGNDTDPDAADTRTAVLDAGPGSALSFTLNADGSFSYTPALNFTGMDSFSYHANDGIADTNVATVTITVGAVNDAPVGNDDMGGATDEDTPFTTSNVLTNDTDVDMDMLSVLTADMVSAQGAAITDLGDGTFGYDPRASMTLNALSVGQMTTDTFGYTVTDGLLNDTATVSVDVTGVNDSMTANDDGGLGYATDEDTSFTTGNVLANDTDPDAADTLTVMSVDPASAQGATITDNLDGTFTYDPTGAAALQALAGGAMLTDTFGYTATDGNGSMDTATVSIEVTGINDAPVIDFPTGGATFNNLGPVNIDTAATLTDPDSTDFDMGDLTASVALSADTSMCDGNDVLTVEDQGTGAGQIGFDGTNVSYEGTQFGTVTTNYLCMDMGGGVFGVADPLLIAFDANASQAAVTALLQALQYNTTSIDDQDREASAMVTDGDGGTSNAALATVTVNLNQPPTITSDGGGATAMVNAAENQTAVTTVTATDPNVGDTLTFSISGGADAGAFSIGMMSGVLTFTAPPDFENPTDTGMDNVYDVQVTVTDDGAPMLSDAQDIAVTVTDANEAPTITSDGAGATAMLNAAENQTAVTMVTATDPDLPPQNLTFTISGGADAGAFSIGAMSGVLTFTSAPDFENPTDTGMDNVYDVQVTVTDDGTPMMSDLQDIAVTVTNVNDPPVITSDGGGATATVNVDENTTAVTDVDAVDQDGDAEGGGGLTYALSGDDAALFGIDALGMLTFNAAPDFENPGDLDTDNDYLVTVTVTDSGLLTDAQDITVSVQDVNEAPTGVDDGFTNVIINTRYEVIDSAGAGPFDPPRRQVSGNLLNNDTDPDAADAGALVVQAVTDQATTHASGTGRITINADGTFSYLPPLDIAGDASTATFEDSFVYTVEDTGGLTDTATINFSILMSPVVWYIDNSQSAGDGRSSSPYNAIAAFNGSTGPSVGDTVFIHSQDGGNAAYTTGINLQDGQILLGEGVDLVIDSTTLVGGGAGQHPNLTTTNATGISLASGNTVRGLNVGNTGSGTGIVGTNFGTLTIDDVTINGTGGILNLDTGTVSDPTPGTFTFSSLGSTSNPGIGIDLNAVGGGFTVDTTTSITGGTLGIDIDATPAAASLDFGATTIGGGTDAGIDIATSGSGTFTFDSLSITNDSGTGLLANAGGTINVGGATNTIGSTGGPGIDLTNTSLGAGATFSNVSSSGSSGDGINLDSVTGSLTINGGSITGSTGIAFDLNAGSSNVTYAGGITNTSGLTVDVTNRTGGTALFNGSVSGTGAGTGINLNGNGTGTITFSGGVNLSTSTSTGFNATGGGIVNVTGAGNTLTTTTGTALNVASTNIGASGLTFQSIAANGGTNGIVLNGTGTMGGLTVTGTGAADSGGIIQNTSGVGISLTSVSGVSLTRMRISATGDDGIGGSNVTNLIFDNGTIINAGTPGVTNENGIDIAGLFGTMNAINNSSITRSAEFNVRIENSTATNAAPGTPDMLTVTSSAFGDNEFSGTGADGIFFGGINTANMKLDVSAMACTDCRTDGVQADAGNTATVEFDITTSTFTSNNIGLNISSSATARMNYDVNANTSFTAHTSNIINVAHGVGSGDVDGQVVNNPMIDGSVMGNGVRVIMEGAGAAGPIAATLIDNNVITDFNNPFGIHAVARAGTAAHFVTIEDNSVTQTNPMSFADDAVRVESGNGTAGEANVVCLDIETLAADGGGGTNTASSPFGDGYEVQQRTGTTFQLEGLNDSNCGGSPCNGTVDTDVEEHITDNNTGTANVRTASRIVNYTHAASCPAPLLLP